MNLDAAAIRAEAEEQFREEQHRAAVAREVQRLRERAARPLLKRLLDLIPFNVTVTRKSP